MFFFVPIIYFYDQFLGSINVLIELVPIFGYKYCTICILETHRLRFFHVIVLKIIVKQFGSDIKNNKFLILVNSRYVFGCVFFIVTKHLKLHICKDTKVNILLKDMSLQYSKL